MGLSETISILGDVAEITVTILLAYVVYKIAALVDTINHRIKEERKPQ